MSSDDTQPAEASIDERDDKQLDIAVEHRRAQYSGEVFECHRYDEQ